MVCILRYSHFNCLSVVCLTVSVGWYLDLCLILLPTNDSRVASRSDGPTPRGERGGSMSQRSPSVTGCLSEWSGESPGRGVAPDEMGLGTRLPNGWAVVEGRSTSRPREVASARQQRRSGLWCVGRAEGREGCSACLAGTGRHSYNSLCSSSARLKITSPELVRACTDHRLVTSSVTLVWRPPPSSERHEVKLYVVRIAKTSCWYRTTKGTTLSGIGTLTKRRLVSNAPNHPRAQTKPKTTNRAHCKKNRSREQRSAARNSAAMCSRFKVHAPSTQSTVCWAQSHCSSTLPDMSATALLHETGQRPEASTGEEGCPTVDRKRR